MNNLDGWKDKFIDEDNDLIVVLASYGNDLIAYSSAMSRLYKHKLKLKQYFDEE